MRKFRYSQGFRVDENNSLQMKGCQIHVSITEHNMNQGRIQKLFNTIAYEFSQMVNDEITEHTNNTWDMEGDNEYAEI